MTCVPRLEEGSFQEFGDHLQNLWLDNNKSVGGQTLVQHFNSFLWLLKLLLFLKLKMCFRISDIPQTTFEDLTSLEWLKLNNNKLRSLPYELVEPILDTVKHIDIHGETSRGSCATHFQGNYSFMLNYAKLDMEQAITLG